MPARAISARRFAPVALIFLGLVAFYAFRLDRFVSFDVLREHREALQRIAAAHPVSAPLGFLGLYALAVAFSIPAAIWITLAGGFLFGLVLGTVLSVIGATMGAFAIFLAARYAFHDALHRRVGHRLARFEAGFQRNAFGYLLFLRLVPLFPFWLVNLVPAFLGMSAAGYAGATFLGIIPGSFIYVGIGSGLDAVLAHDAKPDLMVLLEPMIFWRLIGLGVLALVPALYRRFRSRLDSGMAGVSK